MSSPRLSRRRSIKNRIRPIRGSLRFGAAVLAIVAICVWPVWADTCCCRAAAAFEIASDLPSCCQTTANRDFANKDSSRASDSGCSSDEHVECATCDGVKHECPCEVRTQNLDRWVGTRSVPADSPESGRSGSWSAGLSDFGLPSSVPTTSFFAGNGQLFSITSADRCALLCRWLN